MAGETRAAVLRPGHVLPHHCRSSLYVNEVCAGCVEEQLRMGCNERDARIASLEAELAEERKRADALEAALIDADGLVDAAFDEWRLRPATRAVLVAIKAKRVASVSPQRQDTKEK